VGPVFAAAVWIAIRARMRDVQRRLEPEPVEDYVFATTRYTMEWLRHHDRYEDAPVIPVGGLSRPARLSGTTGPRGCARIAALPGLRPRSSRPNARR
jgi:hypothetical protein